MARWAALPTTIILKGEKKGEEKRVTKGGECKRKREKGVLPPD